MQFSRIPELDGLRGAAILMVIVYHYVENTWVTQPGSWAVHLQAAIGLGWTGVDLFFVLSGFLIGGILLDARGASDYFQVFYTRRFFRIVPLYLVVLLISPSILVFIRHFGNINDFLFLAGGRQHVPFLCFLTFTQNFWMAYTEKFGALSLAVTWSLAIEEQFYLTLPVLVRWLSRPSLIKVVRFGIYLAPLLRIGLGLCFHHNWIAPFTLMPCRMDALLMGVLAAAMLRDASQREWIQRTKAFRFVIPVLALGMVAFTTFTPTPDNPVIQSFGYSWIALFYVTVLLYTVTRTNSLASRALRVRWLGWLGGIAYGVYLLHQTAQGLLFGLVWHREPFITGGWSLLTTLAALFATLLIGHFSFRYFEGPLLRVARNYGSDV